MKKIFSRIGAILGSVAILTLSFGTFASALNEDKSYSYIYDFWGDVQDCPDPYTVCKVFTSADLGLETKMNKPQALFVQGEYVYVCDTGNNRILELKRESTESLVVNRIIDSFTGDVEVTTLSGPTDIAVNEAGDMFIADKGNYRIIKLDKDLNFLQQYYIPDDSSLAADLSFCPDKLVIDSADRVYAIADGINKGLIKYEPDATFSGFVGATKASYDWTTYLYKRFASQEQLANMESFVPTEYDNIYIDIEGFIYAVSCSATEDDLRQEKADAVRKLNLLGADILVRNGDLEGDALPIYGDLYWGDGGNYSGSSKFEDVTVLDNDVYFCLDKNRGRVFAYDDQGNMLYTFGGNGNMDGYFRNPVSIEHQGYDLMVLDELDCAITLYIPTEFGSKIFSAMDLFDEGEYEASQTAWERIMQMDGNYTAAYIGIGRALLRQEQYKEAMDYFKLKYDADNYSKAFKQYRKQWVEEHIAIIVIVILAIFLIPLGIGRVKAIKHEIDIADIFRL